MKKFDIDSSAKTSNIDRTSFRKFFYFIEDKKES